MNRLRFIKTGLAATAAYGVLRTSGLAASATAAPAKAATENPDNVRPPPDQVLVDIADYVRNYKVTSDEAYSTAHYCLIDTLGCGIEALNFPACTKLLGPIVP